mmetsp:Transcript_42772/g.68824  ORF Transcript_42772/g.68824 Transcript_42772/m.68824 type:complete len:173 (+) Transcript_42772:136-654(+)
MPLAPVHVEYCSLCSCPPEFCHYAGCKGVALETALGKVSVSGGDGEGGAAAGASVGGEGAAAAAGGGEDGDKKLPGGKSKKKKDKMVTITRSTRNKKKMITTVNGLDLFDVKLVDASKLFGKKFACGASITKAATGKEEIDVQGDFSEEMAKVISDKFGIDSSNISFVDKGK